MICMRFLVLAVPKINQASLYLMAASLIVPTTAFAQSLGLADGTSGQSVTTFGGSGWAEWNDGRELVAFLTDAVVTLVLAALIAHHPIRRRDPPTLQSVAPFGAVTFEFLVSSSPDDE